MHEYLYYLSACPLIFLLSAKFLRVRKKYFWYEYLALFLLPLIAMVLMSYSIGSAIIWVFFIFCIVGPLIEALAGYTILWMTGKHLWLYESHPIFNRTTSIISIPFWGFAGTVFYSIDRLIGSVWR